MGLTLGFKFILGVKFYALCLNLKWFGGVKVYIYFLSVHVILTLKWN